MATTPYATQRQPLDEVADDYHLTRPQLDALLRDLRIVPKDGSVSMAQDKRIGTYLYRMRRLASTGHGKET